jgi:hypothetical protein
MPSIDIHELAHVDGAPGAQAAAHALDRSLATASKSVGWLKRHGRRSPVQTLPPP